MPSLRNTPGSRHVAVLKERSHEPGQRTKANGGGLHAGVDATIVDTRSRFRVCSPAQGGPLATARSHEHLFASVRELEPLIRAHQASADRLGCMPAAVMDAFFERDLFRILLPSDLGGGGVAPRFGGVSLLSRPPPPGAAPVLLDRQVHRA